MARRNPMNERYRSNSDEAASKGKTRKSAASAKPVAKAGASVRPKTPTDPKERRKQEREKQRQANQQRVDEPVVYTEKEQKWRKVWWGCFILAILCLAISWLGYRISAEYAQQITIGAMVAAYVFLAGMIFVDIKFVRPARLRAREKGSKPLSKKQRRDRERREAAAAAERAANPTGLDRVKNWLNSTGKENKSK